MNRYYYVSVMDSCIQHDGVSLRDHLRVIDPNLFDKECVLLEEECNLETEPGILSNAMLRHVERFEEKIEAQYEENQIPRHLVIVYNDGRFYELSSEEEVDPVILSDLKHNEMLGVEVVELFMDQPKYAGYARRFFQLYKENKHLLEEENQHLLEEKTKTSIKQKVLQRFPFLSGRNS
ncbi:MAG: hypothetical protein IKQ06_07180 [Bacilli bacterium]|nr:hypothetical protein [Bacilli bacterium]